MSIVGSMKLASMEGCHRHGGVPLGIKLTVLFKHPFHFESGRCPERKALRVYDVTCLSVSRESP
jgi:hypothetical protein